MRYKCKKSLLLYNTLYRQFVTLTHSCIHVVMPNFETWIHLKHGYLYFFVVD